MSENKNTTRKVCKPIKIGDRCGRLVIIGEPFSEPCPTVRRPNRTTVKVECRCDCGSVQPVSIYHLEKSATLSCGCLRREAMARTAKTHNFRHGHARSGDKRTPEYNVWSKLRKRCLSPKDKDFPRYGGRGITVCEEWQQGFEAFYRDMGPRPSRAHSIERKDNDGPYASWNCRWATAKEQAENRRNTITLEHDGKRMTQMEWSRITGIGVTTISYRLSAGWPVAEALTKPTNYRKGSG